MITKKAIISFCFFIFYYHPFLKVYSKGRFKNPLEAYRNTIEGLIEKFKVLTNFCLTFINFLYLPSIHKKRYRKFYRKIQIVDKFLSHFCKFSVFTLAYSKRSIESFIEKFKLLINFCLTFINFLYLPSIHKKRYRKFNRKIQIVDKVLSY
jgi:hypothetical protein